MVQKMFVISEGLRDGLVQYMQTRPYQEVAGGIANLMQLPELPSAPKGDGDGKPAASKQK